MLKDTGKKTSKWKMALAVIGAAYLVGAVGWAGYHFVQNRVAEAGPNLAAMPDRVKDMLVERELNKIADQLDLDKEQRETVRTLVRDSGITEAPPQKMLEIFMGLREKLRTVLRPEQLVKLDALEKERSAKMSERIMGMMKVRLKLTPEQEEKVRAIVADFNPLTGSQDAATPPQQRMAEARKRIRELLTPEQQEMLDKMPMLAGAAPQAQTDEKEEY